MIRTLFVDDEVDVLDGLQNRLRRLRKRWDMAFAVGAEQALSKLAESSFDVIVSDMRMPGMDGAALLAKVREEHPHMVRIVLSGQTEKEEMLRSLSFAHQFLSKPCDAKVLQHAVERAITLNAELMRPAVRELVSRVEALPTLPTLYADLSEAIQADAPTLDAVTQIVQQDPSMTARLLQVANSAVFSRPHGVTHVHDAVTYLGLNTVRSVLLFEGLLRALDTSDVAAAHHVEEVQSHSLRVARLAASIAPEAHARTAFAAAMLHDIGSVVIAAMAPDAFRDTRAFANASQLPQDRAEFERQGYTHAELGGALLALWGIPYPVVEAVTFHHQPSRTDESQLAVLGAVHFADWLIHEQERPDPALRNRIDEAYAARVGVTDADVERWRACAAQQEGGMS